MRRMIAEGSAYFALVFAAGFLLGALRVLVLAPRLGEGAAVLVELPAMLAFSWIACARVVRWRDVARDAGQRLGMGGIAFALLMAGEAALAVLGFGRTLPEHVAGYLAPERATGLGAQIAFALIPLVQAQLARR
jgi:hypothetical protein